MTTLRDAAQALARKWKADGDRLNTGMCGPHSSEGATLQRCGNALLAALATSPETPPADPPRAKCRCMFYGDGSGFPSASPCDCCGAGAGDPCRHTVPWAAASPREDPPGALREASRRLLLIVPHFVSTQADPRYHTVAGEVIDTKHEACPACAVRDALASPPSPSDTTSPVNSPEGDTKETKP